MTLRNTKLARLRARNPTETLEISAHADAAMRSVRVLLGVLSCFVVGAYRPLTGPPSWGSLTALLALIIALVVLLNGLSSRLSDSTASRWLLQSCDVTASVGLVILLDKPLGQQSWVLLLVPVVSAAVRYSAAASVASWAGGCAAYIAAGFAGLLDANHEPAALARIPGALLAVAITVGILARWMREGWEIQNELTKSVATQENRLAVIERTGRALRGQPTEDALKLSASQMLELGFDAATIEYLKQDHDVIAVGQTDLVAGEESDSTPPSVPVVTVWLEDQDVRVHSISVYEPQAGVVISGWRKEGIDPDLSQAFATLVTHVSAAIESSELLRRLRYSASRDALTGLVNRRTLDQELARVTNESGRIAIAFVDLDKFKSINDNHGHEVGDKAIVATARRLESAVGSRGMVARYGGDEFVVLLHNTSIDQAKDVAKSIMQSSHSPIALGHEQLHVGLSIGLATACTPTSPRDVMRGADHALYRAKDLGRGTVVALDLDHQTAQIMANAHHEGAEATPSY